MGSSTSYLYNVTINSSQQSLTITDPDDSSQYVTFNTSFSVIYNNSTLTYIKFTASVASSNGLQTWVYSGGQNIDINRTGTNLSGGKSIEVWFNGATGNLSAGHITSGSASVTYTSKQTASTTYSFRLSYDANGGTGAPSSQSASGQSSSTYMFTIPSTEPTRSGYTFYGWASSASATSPEYQPGDRISVGYSSAKTLYAVWVGNIVTLTFNANGGENAPADITYENVTIGDTYNFTIPQTKPTRSGYTFLGWTGSDTATEATYVAGDTFTIVATQTPLTAHLYAVWSEDEPEVPQPPFCDVKADSWKESKALLIRKDGTWEDACRMYVKDDGTWVQVGTGLGKLTLTLKDESGSAVSGATVSLVKEGQMSGDWNLDGCKLHIILESI